MLTGEPPAAGDCRSVNGAALITVIVFFFVYACGRAIPLPS